MESRLVTIPISHFCEKARWALERAEIPFREERHLQLIHIAYVRRAAGGRTAPVLVAGDEVLRDSTEILEWADRRLPAGRRLYPRDVSAQARRIEDWLDEGLGPDGRLWMYQETLPVVGEMAPWTLAGVPSWERRAFPVLRPLIGPAIRRYLGVGPAEARAALGRVRAVFDEVGERLGDGRRFLCGDRFTAADLTFAALSAAVLIPEGYGSPLPPLEVLPPAMAHEVRLLRRHPAGCFAERLYAEERRC